MYALKRLSVESVVHVIVWILACFYQIFRSKIYHSYICSR